MRSTSPKRNASRAAEATIGVFLDAVTIAVALVLVWAGLCAI
jgi:hypothetical protein